MIKKVLQLTYKTLTNLGLRKNVDDQILILYNRFRARGCLHNWLLNIRLSSSKQSYVKKKTSKLPLECILLPVSKMDIIKKHQRMKKKNKKTDLFLWHVIADLTAQYTYCSDEFNFRFSRSGKLLKLRLIASGFSFFFLYLRTHDSRLFVSLIFDFSFFV